MQLNDLKKKANDSIRQLSNVIHKNQLKTKFKYIFYASVLIAIGILIAFIINISNLFFHLKVKTYKANKSSPILKSAEEAYDKGFLENSAIYYKSYLNEDISKVEKVLTYKRLFEISVLNNNLNEALVYLNNLQEADNKLPEIYINKIKIYLRSNQTQKAFNEIIRNQQKLKKSIEFKEISAIYYIKAAEYNKALKILETIPYNKRDYNIHKEIILCYVGNKSFDRSLSYLDKVERKVISLEERNNLAELLILKSLIKILTDDLMEVDQYLEKSLSLSSINKDITYKFLLYIDIILQKSDSIYDIFSTHPDIFKDDPNITKVTSDYFYNTKEYDRAIELFNFIEENRSLNQEELLLTSNINYFSGDYTAALDTINSLVSEYNFKSAALYKNFALIYHRLGDFQNELFYLKEGIQEYPTDLDFYVRLAKFFIDREDTGMAINYVEEAKRVYEQNKKNIIYDARLDNLYILALEIENRELGEKELLSLREKEHENSEYLFNIIKYYIKNHNYDEAVRELETVETLALNENQKKMVLIYKLVLSKALNNDKEYQEIKSLLIKNKNESDINKINVAVIYLFDENPDETLSILDSINASILTDEAKNKILYLKALSYYYKRNNAMALRHAQMILNNDIKDIKTSYLKGIIANQGRK